VLLKWLVSFVRYIVMQSQQAMNVSNPLTLLNFLESSIGTGSLLEEIQQTTVDQHKSIDRVQELKTEIQRSLKVD